MELPTVHLQRGRRDDVDTQTVVWGGGDRERERENVKWVKVACLKTQVGISRIKETSF